MAEWDWSPYVVGGATRPDSFSGMNPQFASALQQMFAGAPEHVRQNLRVGSGYRSPQRQAELWAGALKKYGSPEVARKWVAPPGRSGHNMGHAADLKYLNDEARKWAHANAAQYGLTFPLSNENWHIELVGARGGKHQHAPQVAPTVANMQNKSFDPVGEVIGATAPTAPQGLAGMFTPTGTIPVIPGAEGSMAPMPQTIGALAALFAQQQTKRNEERAAEAEAEQMRRAALFSQDSLAGLFGAA